MLAIRIPTETSRLARVQKASPPVHQIPRGSMHHSRSECTRPLKLFPLRELVVPDPGYMGLGG